MKKLTDLEKEICLKTLSSKSLYALVGSAILSGESLSVVRMGDGERKILEADTSKAFTSFNKAGDNWNQRLGVEGITVSDLQKKIEIAGNTCTYFAPSISGISFPQYYLYNFFQPRPYYFDNFFVNDWSREMIQTLIEASDGIFILHRDYKQIINNFNKNYSFSKPVRFAGFPKNSWEDNDEAVAAALNSGMQLILFSAGPGGKIIGPEIAKSENKIVLDIGNTLVPWSEKK